MTLKEQDIYFKILSDKISGFLILKVLCEATGDIKEAKKIEDRIEKIKDYALRVKGNAK